MAEAKRFGDPISPSESISEFADHGLPLSMEACAVHQMMNAADSSIPFVSTVYAEESAFLWLTRQTAIRFSGRPMSHIVEIEDRLEANIDGLRIAGEAGWQICLEALSWKEPGELFAAGVLAFEANDPKKIDKILAAAVVAPEAAGGVISALGWVGYDRVKPIITKLIASKDFVHRRIGIGSSAVCREHPGAALAEAIKQDEPMLRARAIKAVGELGAQNLILPVRLNLNSPDPLIRFWAAWACVIVADVPVAITALQEIAQSKSVFRERAARLVPRRLDMAASMAWIKKLKGDPKQIRTAILAAGALGTSTNVPWLIEQMSDLKLSRVAGESLSMITGIDLAKLDLERKPPENFESGPNDDPNDENVDLDPDDWLPWPDPALVQKWWTKNAGRFTANVRYLVGKPIDPAQLRQVLIDGKQRQRAAAAVELAIRTPGKPMFEVRMPGFRQLAMLNR